ncbi:hypothetical protein ACHAWF_003975 [Thalassiosira exigua]
MSTVSPSVTDHVAVGTEAILESGHVSEGPGRIASAPIPSIFSDDRGSIHRLRVGHQRINLLFSQKECMRSGYLNNVLTHDFVVKGKVELWILTDKGTEKAIYGPREYFSVDAYVPHILYFLEDTNLVEWYDGTFKCWYYFPYRNIVNVQNSQIESQLSPRHQFLIPRNEPDPMPGHDRGVSTRRLFCYTTTALLSGLVLGALAVTHPKSKR